ncbi:hypothetical protein LSH36_108g05027 [Paralvinella palmiformis]|uniref:Ras-like protein family member 10B n=1 Tax=Paralvinella palmiformis TaxID=53620 RepID=A0AAD9K022_9ANNE|nr:hypothetical protein LSH36_108g05027 [Paralvinella palmiformis]
MSPSTSVPYVKMATQTHGGGADSEFQHVKIALLGAQGVGKTSIVQQFVCNTFTDEYVPTKRRICYHPSIIINDHLYEVKITDFPMIPYFPISSLYEWSDYRGCGLRNATAYVLVFDITNEESFHYIRSIRDQILASRNGAHDLPILVVGNKFDLNEDRNTSKREVASVVKKQWKCAYIECSAKYNWHIVLLFKELMKLIDHIDYGHKPASIRMQDAFRRNRCVIL